MPDHDTHRSAGNAFGTIYLAGTTGSGKTAVTLHLAEKMRPAAIVNSDAFQIYRGMEILSAAPTPAEREQVPHHLFGILAPDQTSDAADFAERARQCIHRLVASQNVLVTGGSGLYLKAITHGLAPTPRGDAALRRELDALSLEELVERYRELDPAGAEKTNLLNRRYVTRNLEITLLSGQPASLLKQQWQSSAPPIRAYYLHRERADIYERINQRTHAMFAAGVVEEVARLGPLSDTAAKAIGLREIQQLLRGEITEEDCIAAIQQATRRYAKRQQTWFQRETAFHRVEVDRNESAASIADRVHRIEQEHRHGTGK